MNVTAHQEKEKNEETKKGRRKKRENKRPILKKLYASLLRSFRGQHSEKMKGRAGVTGILGKTNSHFYPNKPVGHRTTMLKRLLIGAGSKHLLHKSTPMDLESNEKEFTDFFGSLLLFFARHTVEGYISLAQTIAFHFEQYFIWSKSVCHLPQARFVLRLCLSQ